MIQNGWYVYKNIDGLNNQNNLHNFIIFEVGCSITKVESDTLQLILQIQVAKTLKIS